MKLLTVLKRIDSLNIYDMQGLDTPLKMLDLTEKSREMLFVPGLKITTIHSKSDSLL